MVEIMRTITGIDVMLFALGGGIVGVLYEVVLRRMRDRFDRWLDATWRRAHAEGWEAGARAARSLDRAIADVTSEACDCCGQRPSTPTVDFGTRFCVECAAEIRDRWESGECRLDRAGYGPDHPARKQPTEDAS